MILLWVVIYRILYLQSSGPYSVYEKPSLSYIKVRVQQKVATSMYLKKFLSYREIVKLHFYAISMCMKKIYQIQVLRTQLEKILVLRTRLTGPQDQHFANFWVLRTKFGPLDLNVKNPIVTSQTHLDPKTGPQDLVFTKLQVLRTDLDPQDLNITEKQVLRTQNFKCPFTALRMSISHFGTEFDV